MSIVNLGDWRLRKRLQREQDEDQARRDRRARERSELFNRLLDGEPEPPSAA